MFTQEEEGEENFCSSKLQLQLREERQLQATLKSERKNVHEKKEREMKTHRRERLTMQMHIEQPSARNASTNGPI